MLAKLALGWLVGMLAAQDPDPTPTPPVDPASAPPRVELVMRCTALGRREPRFTSTEAGAADSFRWVDRKWSFAVDGKALAASADVSAALREVLAADQRERAARVVPAEAAPTPVLHVDPGDGARWGEIVGIWDLAAEAGFEMVTIDDVEAEVRRVGEVLGEPLVVDGALLVPQAKVSVVFDNVARSDFVIEVWQDGRAGDPHHVLFTPRVGKADDLTRLREFLLSARAALQRQGHLVARPGKTEPWLDVALVVRADRWADWRDVRRVLALATTPEIGFWNVGFVASNRDLESELRREREKR